MLATIIVILFVLYMARKIFTSMLSADPIGAEEQDEAIIAGKFTPEKLQKYNGSDHPKIFIAVRGKIYDVTQGSAFYGPGGPYENFAGRDASRGLAKNSFEMEYLTPIDAPIDSLNDLSELEIESLDGWEQHFENKYGIVGTLHNELP
ncbi:uncharacterized protein PRCAT00001918001 [Priceomyces carsonii]|uniref:uncharacterized protein n=1 Tax=Priceomyces carsonii TaxID=28549 RepID=UPI002ED8A639|nr:unnamed protein product [Priceomyces carsonii]